MNAIAYAFDAAASARGRPDRGPRLVAGLRRGRVRLGHLDRGLAEPWPRRRNALVAESLAGWQEKYPDVEITRHSTARPPGRGGGAPERGRVPRRRRVARPWRLPRAAAGLGEPGRRPPRALPGGHRPRPRGTTGRADARHRRSTTCPCRPFASRTDLHHHRPEPLRCARTALCAGTFAPEAPTRGAHKADGTNTDGNLGRDGRPGVFPPPPRSCRP